MTTAAKYYAVLCSIERTKPKTVEIVCTKVRIRFIEKERRGITLEEQNTDLPHGKIAVRVKYARMVIGDVSRYGPKSTVISNIIMDVKYPMCKLMSTS